MVHLLFEHLVLFCLLKVWRGKSCFSAEAKKWVLLIDDLGPCPLEDVDLVNIELASTSLDLEVRRKCLGESTADQEVRESRHFKSGLWRSQTSIEDREEFGPDVLEFSLQQVDEVWSFRE